MSRVGDKLRKCHCGKRFVPKSNAQIHCSLECRVRWNGREPVPVYRRERRKCLVCPNEFIPYRASQVYCSGSCQMTNYNLIHDIVGRLRAGRGWEEEDV